MAANPGSSGAGRLGSLALILYVALLRLPYVGLGFGSDWDAWLLATSGRRLAAGAGYAPSRPPGYPASEVLFGAFEGFGPIATNLVAVLASVLAALALARLLAPAGRLRALLLAACASSLPIAIVAGSSTMDYTPSLAAFLWALVAAREEQAHPSAVLFALSVALRPATLALAPVWYLFAGRRATRAGLLATALITLAAIPPVCALGLAHLRPTIGNYPSRYMIAQRVWDETFGPIGLTALLGAAALLAFVRRPREDATRQVQTCMLRIGILGSAVYLWMPYEAGYLLAPAMAGVVCVGLQARTGLLLPLAAALLISPHLDPINGSTALARDADFRGKVAQAADAFRRAAPEIPRPATVVTGFLMPQWLYAVGDSESLHGVLSISAERGARVYYVPTIAAWHRRIFHVDLEAAGAIPLPTREAILLSGLDFQN
jgi:hypothetical protein